MLTVIEWSMTNGITRYKIVDESVKKIKSIKQKKDYKPKDEIIN